MFYMMLSINPCFIALSIKAYFYSFVPFQKYALESGIYSFYCINRNIYHRKITALKLYKNLH